MQYQAKTVNAEKKNESKATERHTASALAAEYNDQNKNPQSSKQAEETHTTHLKNQLKNNRIRQPLKIPPQTSAQSKRKQIKQNRSTQLQSHTT